MGSSDTQKPQVFRREYTCGGLSLSQLPHTPHRLARGSQTACYPPWFKVSVALRYVRGHPKRGARCGSTSRGSWLSRTAFARPDGSTEREDPVLDRRTFLAGTGAVLSPRRSLTRRWSAGKVGLASELQALAWGRLLAGFRVGGKP